MNFVFDPKSHDLFWGVGPDTVFTVLASFFLFALGYAANRWYDNSKDRRYFKHLRRLVAVFLEGTIAHAEKQVEAYRSLAGELNAGKYQDYVFNLTAVRTDYLQSFSQIDLFRAIIQVKKSRRAEFVNHFNILLDSLAFMHRQAALAREQFEYFIDNHKRYVAQWNAAADAILRLHDQYTNFASQAGINSDDDPFLKQLILIVHTWNTVPNRKDFAVVQENLLDPIKSLCKEHPADPRDNVLIPLVLEASDGFRNRNRLLKLFYDFFSEQGEKLDLHTSKIKKILGALRDTGATA